MRLLKIGRDQSCDITLNSERVSSLHAELTLLNSGDILLEDKGSRNGTYVMNHPIKPGKAINVRRGDAIRFADVELQWSQVPVEDNTGYKAVWGIGSDFHNDFQISGATVSRFHATVKQATDGKFFIFDHSKNGTTVDGQKIMPNNPYRIKKNSAIACGGVPIDLVNGPAKLPWPSDLWKILLASAASLLLLVGIGFGAYKLINKGGENQPMAGVADSTLVAQANKKYTDTELYQKYNHSVVMLLGVYHYEINYGSMPEKLYQQMGLPKRCLFINNNLFDVSNFTPQQLVEIFTQDGGGMFGGTGFFISNDGKLLTNLHVAKPWLYKNDAQLLEDWISAVMAGRIKRTGLDNILPELNAYVSKVKVEGVLDYIALIPQGETFDPDNIKKCRIVVAGDEVDKDIALIQTMTKRMPYDNCTYIDLDKDMELSEDSIMVGKHVLTMGFPKLDDNFLQREAKGAGIQVIAQGGNIIQKDFKYDFGHNAATTGGASGSPIFNEYGKLIGIHHAGMSALGTQGYNYGVKAKYIKELLSKQ